MRISKNSILLFCALGIMLVIWLFANSSQLFYRRAVQHEKAETHYITVDGRAVLDINTATHDELTALPGIGDTIAGRIIDARETNGRFDSVDDLLDIEGIGNAKLDKLRDAVGVQ